MKEKSTEKSMEITDLQVMIVDTRRFLELVAEDPSTVYPLVITTRSGMHSPVAVKTSVLDIIRTREELDDFLDNTNRTVGMFPVGCHKMKDQTNIDLEGKGECWFTAKEISNLGIFKGEKLRRHMNLEREKDLEKVYRYLLMGRGFIRE